MRGREAISHAVGAGSCVGRACCADRACRPCPRRQPAAAAAGGACHCTAVASRRCAAPTRPGCSQPAAKPAAPEAKAAAKPGRGAPPPAKAAPAPIAKAAAAAGSQGAGDRAQGNQGHRRDDQAFDQNQVDDLLSQFRVLPGQAQDNAGELRRPFDLLVLKLLSLLQDSDPTLAAAIVASREAIWGILSDRTKFASLDGG